MPDGQIKDFVLLGVVLLLLLERVIQLVLRLSRRHMTDTPPVFDKPEWWWKKEMEFLELIEQQERERRHEIN